MSRRKYKNTPLATVPTCIFCGAPANSKEHSFPVWLIEAMDEWYKGKFGSKDTDPKIPPYWECNDGSGSQSEVRVENIEITIQCVCDKCNSGWMGEIQNNHARIVIERLLKPGPHILDRQDYTSLTIWSVMTAMVLDIRNDLEERRFVEVENVEFWHRHKDLSNNFRQENIYVPRGFRVWLAGWKNSTGPSIDGRLLSNTGMPEKGVVNTIGFGTMAIQIVRTPRNIPIVSRPGQWDRTLLQIFPPPGGDITFPPIQEFDGYDGIEELDMRFCPPDAKHGRPSEEEHRKGQDIVRKIADGR